MKEEIAHDEAFTNEKYEDAQALEDDIATGHNGEQGLQRNLKARHLAMISLGMSPLPRSFSLFFRL